MAGLHMADSQSRALFQGRQSGLTLFDNAVGQRDVTELVRKMLLGDWFDGPFRAFGKSDFSAI